MDRVKVLRPEDTVMFAGATSDVVAAFRALDIPLLVSPQDDAVQLPAPEGMAGGKAIAFGGKTGAIDILEGGKNASIARPLNYRVWGRRFVA